jgi:hypothetical protein
VTLCGSNSCTSSPEDNYRPLGQRPVAQYRVRAQRVVRHPPFLNQHLRLVFAHSYLTPARNWAATEAKDQPLSRSPIAHVFRFEQIFHFVRAIKAPAYTERIKMSAQITTATRPPKPPVPVKQLADDDVFERIQNTLRETKEESQKHKTVYPNETM